MNKIVVLTLVIVLLAALVVAEESAISVVPTPEEGMAPLQVNFTVTARNDLVSYAWDFNEDGMMDSTEAAPSFTYALPGSYRVNLTAKIEDNETISAQRTIMVKPAMSISVTATPSSGVAPLAVQFTSAASGKEPLSYTWDFDADGTMDSTQQNPATTFEQTGQYNITLTVTDGDGNSTKKIVPITVQEFNSQLELSSYFPTTLAQGENQITFILKNGGDKVVKDISAKMVVNGIQYLSSTSIASLKPGEEDSLTVKFKVVRSGNLTGQVKVLDKSFPVSFSIVQEVQYNKDEVQAHYDLLKPKFDEQERVYYEKKAAGYLVGEMFESIKTIKKQLQDTQQQLLTDQLAQAKVNLDLISSALDDFQRDLEGAQKQKVTFLLWLKDNAVAITAIIAALGTMGGFLVKLRGHAKKVGEHALKVSETVRQRIKKSGEKKEAEKLERAEVQEKKEEHTPEESKQEEEK